jgi:hypothetical protein
MDRMTRRTIPLTLALALAATLAALLPSAHGATATSATRESP